jgi:formylglycine-generating enzyme
MRFLISCWLMFLLFLSVPIQASAEDDTSPQGMSASKPSEGPFVEVEGGFMVPYTLTVPGSKVKIEMLPVPGGKLKMGSSENEEGHNEAEGPQVEVEIGPMWVAKYETSWAEYKLYMSMYPLFKTFEQSGLRQVSESNAVDAVTAPTELYDPSFTFEFGEDEKLPAVTMTPFAAKQYTKWLSKLTGSQYRLPTEAEWEYACRGGTATAFHFGDDASMLGDYAWYADNSDEKPHKIGEKKPNPFGLHDMHGNVMEWAVDAFSEDGFAGIASKNQPMSIVDSIRWPETAEDRTARGGSWQDAAEQLRSAARIGSEDEDWKDEDPNVPLSPWWYTDDPARGVGFRLFRSLKPIDQDTISKFWEIDHEDIKFDVESRIKGGRGAQSVIDPDLAKDIEKANQ